MRAFIQFERFLERPATLSDLCNDTVSAFAACRVLAGRSKHTVNRELSNLLAIWRWCHKKGYLTNWPDVEMEKAPKRAPVALTAEELERVTKAIQMEQSPVGDFSGPDFWMSLFLLLWDTGERIGAAMLLEWSEVDLNGRWVRFTAESRKGGRADNVLRFAEDTAAALRKIKRSEGRVFEWPYCETYIYKRFSRIMLRAGLPDSRIYKFHCIRKSTASHFEAAGGNATELLGHSSRKITKAYLDPRIVQTTPAIDLLFRPGEKQA